MGFSDRASTKILCWWAEAISTFKLAIRRIPWRHQPFVRGHPYKTDKSYTMVVPVERVILVILSFLSTCVIGICVFFIKRLVDKVEKTIDEVATIKIETKTLSRLEKRLEAIESLTSNLNRDVSTEFARIHEILKWGRGRR